MKLNTHEIVRTLHNPPVLMVETRRADKVSPFLFRASPLSSIDQT